MENEKRGAPPYLNIAVRTYSGYESETRKPEGQTTLSFRAQNFTKADKIVLTELAALAQKNGITLTVHFDTVVNKG